MAQNCPDCNSACLQKIPDACVVWVGNDIPSLGIKNGDYYNDAIIAFVNKFIELSEGLIDVSSTNDGTCDNCSDKLHLFQAVQRLSDKLSSIKTSDIRLNSSTTGLTGDNLSFDSGKLLNRNLSYFVEANENSGSLVGFDLTDAISNLPDGYQFVSSNISVSGKRKFGSTVVTDSTLPTFSVKVSNDRYHLNVETLIRVNTPSGTADLINNLLIDSPKTVVAKSVLDVKDRSKSDKEDINLNDYIASLSAQVRENKSKVDQLSNLDITGDKNISFTNTNASNVISVLASKLSKVMDDVNTLSSVNYDNSGSTVTGTPVEVMAIVATNINKISSDIKSLKTDIKNINDSLSSLTQNNITLLSQGGGSVNGVTTGGSGGSSSGCPGGNCQ